MSDVGVNDACGGRLIGPEDCYYFFLMFLLSLRCDVKTCNPSTLAENPSNLNDIPAKFCRGHRTRWDADPPEVSTAATEKIKSLAEPRKNKQTVSCPCLAFGGAPHREEAQRRHPQAGTGSTQPPPKSED